MGEFYHVDVLYDDEHGNYALRDVREIAALYTALKKEIERLEKQWTDVPDQYPNHREFAKALIRECRKADQGFAKMVTRAETAEADVERLTNDMDAIQPRVMQMSDDLVKERALNDALGAQVQGQCELNVKLKMDRAETAEADLADAEARATRAIDILDLALGDTEPPEIDYDEKPHGMIIHAMHILQGAEADDGKAGG